MSYRGAFANGGIPNYKIEAGPAAAADGLALCYNSGNRDAAFQTPIISEGLTNGNVTFSGPGTGAWAQTGVSGHSFKYSNGETWATVYIAPSGVNTGTATGEMRFDATLPAGYAGISDTVCGTARILDSGLTYYTCAVNVVGLTVEVSCTAIAGGVIGNCALSGMVLTYRLS